MQVGLLNSLLATGGDLQARRGGGGGLDSAAFRFLSASGVGSVPTAPICVHR